MDNQKVMSLCNLILFCLGTASLEMFYQYTKDPGEIFGRWGLWLTYLWMKNWRRKDRWRRNLIKVMICQHCNGTWLYIITFLITAIFIFPMNLIILPLFGFLGIGLNYVFIEMISKLKAIK